MTARSPLLPLVLLFLVRIAVADDLDTDHWYEFSIGDAPCGYLHRSVRIEGAEVVTRTVEALRISRNGVPIRLETVRVFRENRDGTPLESSFTQTGGGTERSSSIVFSDRTMLLTRTSAAPDAPTVAKPTPEGWLTPRAASNLIRDRIVIGADSIDYRVLRSSEAPGTLRQIRMQRIEDPLPPDSAAMPETSCWRVERQGASLELLEWRDADGVLVESRMDTGLGPLRSVLSTRDRALRALEGPPPDLMSTTLVEAISMPRSSDDIVTAGYHVHFESASGPLASPPSSAGGQRVRVIGDQLYEFEIDASRGSPVTSSELDEPSFIEPSRALDSSDPALVAFTKDVLAGESDDPLERAERLRVAVDRHIHRKSLTSGLDTASEVLRSRSGDCTEHAMLLAATLRVEGIPSRVAVGLVHSELGGGSEPAFVWHMWTQGLIDGQWYDFDPTRPRRFDAGHLLFGLDSLSDQDGGQRMSALLGLVGRLRVKAIMIDGQVVEEHERSPS